MGINWKQPFLRVLLHRNVVKVCLQGMCKRDNKLCTKKVVHNMACIINLHVQFSNLCGAVYKQGNIAFTSDGNSVLSPVGNRISQFDLKK